MSAPVEIVVGTPWLGYPEQRNFVGLNVPGVRFRRVVDPWRVAFSLLGRGRGERGHRWRFRHSRPSFPRCDVLHFFNSVTTAPVPWLVTFETSVPKSAPSPEFARQVIESPWCRGLLALSECARDRQLARWERVVGSADAVRSKLVVAPPPQPLLVEDVTEKPDPAEGVRLVFVGAQFFRKGGRPMMRALDRLLSAGAPIEVDIVSSLEPGDRWSACTPVDRDDARATVARHPERLRLHGRLPNTEVMRLLRGAHALLLPSLAETYGYAVLEAQAAGCAVITTNVRAMPELNPADVGWIIELDLLPGSSVRLRTPDDLADAEERIEAGVIAAVEELIADPPQVLQRGAAALERVRRVHDPALAARRLATWYANVQEGAGLSA